MSIGGQARCCWTRLNSENGKRLWRWLRGNQRGCSSEAALLNCVKFGDEIIRRVSSGKYWTDFGHCGGSNYPLSMLLYSPCAILGAGFSFALSPRSDPILDLVMRNPLAAI